MNSAEKHEQLDANTLLTRAEVAARLGVSTSTVRRYEGEQLHPCKGADGVNRFDPAEVAALAMKLLGEKPPKTKLQARNSNRAAAAPRTPGDIAAEVFARLEQRQSLAEIVVGVRVAPDVVRELHREWQRGLIEGELDREEPVLPAGTIRKKLERRAQQHELAAMLSALPLGTNTRISVARSIRDDEYINGGDEVRRLVELGGFVVQGPIAVAELLRRYGSGEYRVTAYALDPSGLLWEVLSTLTEKP